MPPAQPAQQERLQGEAEDAEDEGSGEHREPERSADLHDRERDVRAQHVEGAVREVDHVHHPEDQGQTRREDEKQGAERKAVQRLLEDLLETHEREASYFPGSATLAILSLIVFTVCPFCVFTSRM